MATTCPKCKNGVLKKGDKMVYCSEYQPKKEGETWINQGKCEFKIYFSQKIFSQNIDAKEIKTIVNGGVLQNKKKDKMRLDLTSKFFTKIEFAEKVEDEDL